MRRIDWRDFFTSGVLLICFVAIGANRVLAFHYYGSKINLLPHTLPWIWATIIPDLLVLLILYTLFFYVGWKYPDFGVWSIVLGLAYAAFIILISSCNIIMLTVTGRNIEWKIVFEVDFTATYSLYVPHVSSFISLLMSHFLLGCTLWSIKNRYNQTHNDQPFGHFKAVKVLVSGPILIYMFVVIFYGLPQPYRNLSSNMVLNYFLELITYYWRTLVFMSSHTAESVLNSVIQAIRAPAVNISHPVVTLKRPIKHVFLIILESIRADALPLNENLANATQSTFSSEGTAAKVTPFLNSLWMNSVRTVASATSSYTLKSLLSIFCGIYPLNVNFLKEINEENLFYQRCLPELLHETFRTKNNQSAFRSAFFTAARGDFDHQRELLQKLKFETINDGFEIYERFGELPDVGMFGPADPSISPLLWKWLDDTLEDDGTSRLMMSLLVTGTHEPFIIPYDISSDKYHDYIDHAQVNAYLNAIRVSDEFLKTIIHGFKSRKLYDETLFIIVSDHGYVFHDYGSQTLGLLSNPLEPSFSIPLMFHNPYLKPKQLHGQFTTMDILPTIMDILLSSMMPAKRSTNQLLSVPRKQLESILTQYEGTTLLRKPIAQQPVRYTFSLANPGDSFIIAKQYPKKLTYDVANDEVHLYHLGYDPIESIDLLALNYDDTATHPSWLKVKHSERSSRIWKGRWSSKTISITIFTQILSGNQIIWSIPNSNDLNNSQIQLSDMLDWAEQTLELTRLWRKLVHKRYHNGSKILHSDKKQELE